MSSSSAPDAVAIETHGLVIATFVLAFVTTLAILIPLVVTGIRGWRRRQSARAELEAIADIIENHLTTLANAPRHAIAGASLDLIVNRIFSSDVAQALSAKSVTLLYAALSNATDVIIALRNEDTKPPTFISRPQAPPQAEKTREAAERQPYIMRTQAMANEARGALAKIRDARAILKKESRPFFHTIRIPLGKWLRFRP